MNPKAMGLAAIAALFLAEGPAAAGQPPSFSDFPAAETYRAPPAAPQLNTPQARMFRTVLRRQAATGPNFAGHYTLARWGCGSGCVSWAIIDAASGAVWFAPFTVSEAFGLGDPELGQHYLDFRLDSELIVANGARNEAGAGRYYYRWHRKKLSLVHAVEYRPEASPPDR